MPAWSLCPCSRSLLVPVEVKVVVTNAAADEQAQERVRKLELGARLVLNMYEIPV